MSGAALGGIKVLDFSHALAGPYCTLLLSDYGAEVYKLESPGSGDMGRAWGPPFVEAAGGAYSHFFLGLNRGKRGIAIDLKQPEGLALCRELLTKMDVLVENFRPGAMERLGLGYEEVRRTNPGLVYCSISGYGQNGPLRDAAAMDLVIECSSGFLSITGTEAAELTRSGYAVCDVNAGLFATIGILMALRAREKTGLGQYVDVSMFDGMISAMSSNYMTFLGSGNVPGPLGTGFLTLAPYRVYACRDGSIGVAVGSEKLWVAFCRALERPDLEAHADFATNPQRVRNRVALDETLAAIFRERPVTEWAELLGAQGVPCSPVHNFAQVAANPQAEARGMFPEIDGYGPVTGPPIKMGATPAQVGAAAPLVGEHTAEVLGELLGVEEGRVQELRERGVIL